MKILVDQEKCANPRDCRICLDRCPEKVFGIYPKGERKPGVRAHEWTIVPLIAGQCNFCKECLSFCPPGAITLLSTG